MGLELLHCRSQLNRHLALELHCRPELVIHHHHLRRHRYRLDFQDCLLALRHHNRRLVLLLWQILNCHLVFLVGRRQQQLQLRLLGHRQFHLHLL